MVATAPAGSTSYVYGFPAGTPELMDFEFRVRVLPDEDGVRASAAIPFHRGLRAPSIACADFGGDQGENPSGIRGRGIERRRKSR